ncbi:MAG TPA: DMT family transporter [Roseiarcus sp.]|nr:DMT family transporter [Roseiarcus sp.]
MPYVMLAFLTLLWGSSFLLIKIASRAFDSTGFAFGRAGIAAAALVAAALAMRLRWPRSPRLWGQMAAMSLSGQVLPFLLFGLAAHLTTSADMALMMGGVPIFTFVIARLFALGEVWNARAALGLALGLVGVAISLASPLGSAAAASASAPGLGRALALLGALGYATGALLSRPVSREIGATMAATGSMAVSAGLLLVLVLALEGLPSPAALAATPLGPLAALCALGLFNTALAYFVYFRLIARAGATFAALNNYMVPCLGLLAGAWTLGEPIGASSWIGLACVLCGVVVTGSAARAQRVIAER